MTGRRASVRFVLGALLWIGSPAPAPAQTGEKIEEVRSEARLRAGFLYLTPSFRLDRLGVDTNVFNNAEQQRDFVAAASPRVDLWIPFQRRALLETVVVTGAEYFHRFAGERSINPEVRSRLEVAAGPVTLFAGGRLLRTRQRPTFEIDLRAQRIQYEVEGGFRLELTRRLSLDLAGSGERLRFDADEFFEGSYLAAVLNRRERAQRIAARWQASVLSTLVLEAESRRMRFLWSPERDSDNVVVTLAGEFHPRALVSGSGRVGVRQFRAQGAAVTDATRVVAGADLRLRLPGGLSATFEAERDIAYSFTRLDPWYLLSRYGVVLTSRLGRGFEISGRAVRDTYDYLGGTGRRDEVRNLSGVLRYRLSPTVSVGLQAGHVLRRSPATRRQFEGLVAGLVFDFGP